ncbi:MAG TPA: maleylpyruvate isomerase family mycothiol-dependent enzyme [Pseudonocardiaceae bacterium]
MDTLTHLRAVTGAFEAELATADPTAPLAVPRWTVTGLAGHLGAVHRWAAANTGTTSRAEFADAPPDADPAAYYAESRAALLSALDGLDPATPCWTFDRADRTVRFWLRRQLHESLVHLWDLRSAADPDAPAPPDVPPDVHADGVDELVGLFLPRADRTALRDLPAPLVLCATDVGRSWAFAPDWTPGPAVDGATTVCGPAGELLLFGWARLRRTDERFAGTLAVDGDEAVVDAFTAARVRP